jgi:drug/metabolite transporter (DMT)-like permease
MPAHFFYQTCLVRSMSRGDLSLVFPIMRGAAPLMSAGAAFLLLGEALPPLALAGLVIAVASVIAFALPPRGVSLRAHPDKAALGWALGTAVGVALYNVADARGVRMAANPFTFIIWLFLVDWIMITAAATLLRRRALIEVVRAKWRFGVAAGALSILSFGAALWAFSMMEVARVSALRETAVVFAAIMGASMLKEGFGRRRILAALALACGLILMQFGG